MIHREVLSKEWPDGANGLELLRFLADPLTRHVTAAPFVVALIVTGIAPRIESGLAPTLILLFAVVTIGLLAVHLTARRTADSRVAWLGDLFLLELVLGMIVLFLGWTPQLNRFSEAFGYDPQRYYFDAQDWMAADYALAAIPSLNYSGVIVYYGAVFTLFGSNPVAPALANLLLSLLTALLVVRTAHWVTAGEPRSLWLAGIFVMLPEVLWYDVLTSREIPAMALVTTVMLIGTRPLVRVSMSSATAVRDVVIATVALLALGVMRTAMLFPAGAALATFVLSGRTWRRHGGKTVLFVGAGVAVAVAAPMISQALGSTAFGYGTALRAILDQKEVMLANYEWSQRSFGQYLIPDTVAGIVALAPARVLLYLVAPWPSGLVSPADLAAGSWDAWQRLASAWSAALYIVLFPFALASAATLIRERRWVRGLVFHIPMWLSLFAVAAGNIIIAERYRVMIIPLIWACIWLGFAAPLPLIRRAYAAWIVIMGVFVTSFLAFKAGYIG